MAAATLTASVPISSETIASTTSILSSFSMIPNVSSSISPFNPLNYTSLIEATATSRTLVTITATPTLITSSNDISNAFSLNQSPILLAMLIVAIISIFLFLINLFFFFKRRRDEKIYDLEDDDLQQTRLENNTDTPSAVQQIRNPLEQRQGSENNYAGDASDFAAVSPRELQQLQQAPHQQLQHDRVQDIPLSYDHSVQDHEIDNTSDSPVVVRNVVQNQTI